MTASQPLTEIEDGKYARIAGFLDERGLEHKLRQLGLSPGDAVRVLRRAPFGGPLLIEVDGRSIALSRGIAGRVLVDCE